MADDDDDDDDDDDPGGDASPNCLDMNWTLNTSLVH